MWDSCWVFSPWGTGPKVRHCLLGFQLSPSPQMKSVDFVWADHSVWFDLTPTHATMLTHAEWRFNKCLIDARMELLAVSEHWIAQYSYYTFFSSTIQMDMFGPIILVFRLHFSVHFTISNARNMSPGAHCRNQTLQFCKSQHANTFYCSETCHS